MRSSLKKLEKSLIDPSVKHARSEDDDISKLHKYWSRKPWRIIQGYIARYSREGDTVLDNFCGSGTIGLECLLQSRHFIGYDLNPSAIFISEQTLDLAFNAKAFDDALDQLVQAVKKPVMDFYKTSSGDYLLYQIQGKNSKSYNALVADYDFKGKVRTTIKAQSDHALPKGLSYPDAPFPKAFYKDRFSYKGVSHVSDLFSKRNLHALTLIYNHIQKSEGPPAALLWLAFSNTLLHVSKLKSENIRPLGVNNYWIPDDYIEENVLWRFLDRAKNVRKAKMAISRRAPRAKNGTSYKLHNTSSLPLKGLKNGSIDYVITDPPYGDAIQYSELSFVWNCWLKKPYAIEDEVIINPKQEKSAQDYQAQLGEFVASTYRVLKPGGYFTLCFHNRDLDIWLEAMTSIRDAGFALEESNVHSTLGNPFNKSWSQFSPKSDLYITFRKELHLQVVKNKVPLNIEALIDTVSRHLRADQNSLDLNRAYDLLVIAIIDAIFSGKDIGTGVKISLKTIIARFKQAAGNDESKPKRHSGSLQTELPL